jgi:hypothetical protein
MVSAASSSASLAAPDSAAAESAWTASARRRCAVATGLSVTFSILLELTFEHRLLIAGSGPLGAHARPRRLGDGVGHRFRLPWRGQQVLLADDHQSGRLDPTQVVECVEREVGVAERDRPFEPEGFGCPATPVPGTPSPAASWARLRAALRSRSRVRPQSSQWKTRTRSESLAFTAPQAEHVLELGYHRPATCSLPPRHPVLQPVARPVRGTPPIRRGPPGTAVRATPPRDLSRGAPTIGELFGDAARRRQDPPWLSGRAGADGRQCPAPPVRPHCGFTSAWPALVDAPSIGGVIVTAP